MPTVWELLHKGWFCVLKCTMIMLNSTVDGGKTADYIFKNVIAKIKIFFLDFHLRKSNSTITSTNMEQIHVMDLEDETVYQTLWNDIDELDICNDTGTSSPTHCNGSDSPQADCHSDSLQDITDIGSLHIDDHTNNAYDNNLADSSLGSQTDGTRSNHTNNQRDDTSFISPQDDNQIDVNHDHNIVDSSHVDNQTDDPQNDKRCDCPHDHNNTDSAQDDNLIDVAHNDFRQDDNVTNSPQDDIRTDEQKDDYTDILHNDNHIESLQDDNHSLSLQDLSSCHPDCDKSDCFTHSRPSGSSNRMVQDSTTHFLSVDSPPHQPHAFTKARQLSGEYALLL